MLPTWLNRPPHRLQDLDQLLPEGTNADVPGSPVVLPLRRIISGFAGLVAQELLSPDEAGEQLASVVAVLRRHRPGPLDGGAR